VQEADATATAARYAERPPDLPSSSPVIEVLGRQGLDQGPNQQDGQRSGHIMNDGMIVKVSGALA
jgi:hypothetical protein